VIAGIVLVLDATAHCEIPLSPEREKPCLSRAIKSSIESYCHMRRLY